MLQPNRRKFRKEQKGRNTGVATRGANVSFGDFGLKATERGRLTARQIEAARIAMGLTAIGLIYSPWGQRSGPSCSSTRVVASPSCSATRPTAASSRPTSSSRPRSGAQPGSARG